MYSINGIGTTLYGKRDVNPADGSYVATEWVVIFFLPILPVGSYRVWRGETKAGFSPLPGSKTSYRIVPVKLNWGQVLNTYLIVWSSFIIGILVLLYMVEHNL